MALQGPRSTYRVTRHALRHCQSCTSPRLSSALPRISRPFSTSTTRSEQDKFDELLRSNEDGSQSGTSKQRPRWSYTPEGMKAPFSPHITKNPARSIWHVNDDPAKLDQMYIKFLGRDGDKLLPEEIKWLAVTHKSFDQGRRGFNDRLAYFGRQAIVLEVARDIVSSAPQKDALVPDEHNRQPFSHPQLDSLDNFNIELPHDIITREKIEQLALDVGLDKVLRWKPRLPENLSGSGIQIVLNGAVHAIIGAVTLQQGGEVAGKIIRERILRRLSLRQ